jgi:hypothetical protein
LYRVTMRLYRVTMRLYRVTMRLYRLTKINSAYSCSHTQHELKRATA